MTIQFCVEVCRGLKLNIAAVIVRTFCCTKWTRWVLSTLLSSLDCPICFLSSAVLSINLISTKKNHRQCQESNPGQLGEKCKRYRCVSLPLQLWGLRVRRKGWGFDVPVLSLITLSYFSKISENLLECSIVHKTCHYEAGPYQAEYGWLKYSDLR